MDEFMLGGLIVLFTAVLPCLVLGFLIAFQGRRGLISGWQEDKISDPEKGGRIIGTSLMVMAVLLAIVTLLWFLHFFTEDELVYFILPCALVPIVASFYVKIKLKIR
ncbi:hypothetical protein Q4493_05980 [Colwellia sp. 1_MG-2023]|uniref:DUF3784 domain-containing protein n=1 Tax=Colwellia sp. 1_MG-2023 TaxID=3062649 RepID=UPI0026E31D16|nr:hypothetical protein [Colwellia sp. 1_MG-2023]MDO6445323.1 hypothetical protein [Colwellia sp. 1_MG-2023]